MSEAEWDTFRAQRIVAYVNIASTVILFWEHMITFDDELQSVWRQRWTPTKFLYIFMKYTAFIQAVLIIFQQIVPSEKEEACLVTFKIITWLFVIGLGAGELLLSIRTWAVWKKPRMMAMILGGFWCVCWGAIFAILAIFLKTVEFRANPNAPFPGCFLSHGNPIFFLDYVLLLLYDTVMLVLILIPAYRSYRMGGTSEFVRSVYRDGIVYYIYLFALSLLNIAIIVKLPFDYGTLLSQMERNLHAVLTGRVVLNIHSQHRNRDHATLMSSHGRQTTDQYALTPIPPVKKQEYEIYIHHHTVQS